MSKLELPTDPAKLVQLRNQLLSLKRKQDTANAQHQFRTYLELMRPGFLCPEHVQLLIDKLEAVERGEITRLAISMPPRHGKSYTVSESFPAWFLGRNPDKYVIAATYAMELSEDFGRKVRNQIMDPAFHEIFPDADISPDSTAIKRFNMVQGGVYFAVGAGGPITGRGAHVLLIDDPIKGHEEADSELQRNNLIEWYKSVAYTRMMPGRHAIVVVATRWHEDDLIGWIERNCSHENWDIVNLPAIARETDPLGRKEGEALWPDPMNGFPIERLRSTEKTLGPRIWSSLYQQSPVSDDGNIFKRKHFQIWRKSEPPKCEYVLQSYDTAYEDNATADYSAIQTWGIFKDENGVHNAILLSSLAERLQFPQLREKAVALYHKHEPDVVLIENKASGASLRQELYRAGIPILPYNPDKSKIARAHAASPIIEAGRVWIPEGKDWAEELVNQAVAFPNGRRDDQVDAMTQALIRLQQGFLVRMPDLQDDAPMDRRYRGYW